MATPNPPISSNVMYLPEEFEAAINDSRTLEDLTVVLGALLSGGYSVWEDGSLYHIRQLVAKVNGLRIEVYAKEHAPPHFHVSGGDIDASFAIADGTFLNGKIGRREQELLKWWYACSREKLIEVWNETRPSDCPVGPIKQNG